MSDPNSLERLKAYRALKVENDTILEQIAILRTQANEYTTTSAQLHRDCDRDVPERICNKFSLLEEQLAACMDNIVYELEACEKIVSSLPNPAQEILRLYYIFGLTWKETAYATHYCERQCRRIAKDAKARLKCPQCLETCEREGAE